MTFYAKSLSLRFSSISSVLLTIFLTLLSTQSWAVTKIEKKKIFSVTKNGTLYSCYLVKNKPLLILKSKKAYVLGTDAIATLKKNLSSSGALKKASGKKKLKSLKDKVAVGNAACANPGDDTPGGEGNDGNGGGGGGGSGSVSLTKLARPLTRTDIQYLLDKAALGLSSREDYLVDIGLNQGIDALVDTLMATHQEPSGLMDRVLDRLDGQLGNTATQSPGGQRSALLDLWIHTNNPYQEKFALFMLSLWTAAGNVIEDETFRSSFWDYYQRLRTYSYSNDAIPDLAVAITRDPLMLIYLNNELNVKGNPNENYARELMELFSLGPTNLDGNPNYTETRPDGTGDIASAARMLTGWKVSKNYIINQLIPSYDNTRHQPGPQIMFPGTPYQFSGENDEDLVRGIFAHHAGAKIYYSKEILKLYLTPNPPRLLIESFADVIESNGFRLADAMRSLLKSEAFYDAAYKDTVPLNSMEFAAKTARELELFNAVNIPNIDWQFQKMGLLYNLAPSVFWYNSDTWSSSGIAIEKANYLAEILNDTGSQTSANWTAARVLPLTAVSLPDLISFVQSRVGLTGINNAQQQAFVSYLSNQLQYNGIYTPFTYNNLNTAHQKTKGLGLYYLMFLTPEFNLL